MKAIKFLVAAVAMAFAMNANAEWKLDLGDGHFTVNANVGSYGPSTAGFGLGVAYQTEVFTCDWLSLDWDVLHFEWDAPFNSPGDSDALNFKTGARAYSPSFANDHLRAYSNLDLGYVLGIASDGDETDASSAFGLDWGIGIQLNKKWSFGYTLEFTKYKDVPGGKSHYATVAYTF